MNIRVSGRLFTSWPVGEIGVDVPIDNRARLKPLSARSQMRQVSPTRKNEDQGNCCLG